MKLADNNIKIIGKNRIPKDFPSDKMVVPTQVKFRSIDGITIHSTMFEKEDNVDNKPAIFIYMVGLQDKCY